MAIAINEEKSTAEWQRVRELCSEGRTRKRKGRIRHLIMYTKKSETNERKKKNERHVRGENLINK
jgi:hypothetical protein